MYKRVLVILVLLGVGLSPYAFAQWRPDSVIVNGTTYTVQLIDQTGNKRSTKVFVFDIGVETLAAFEARVRAYIASRIAVLEANDARPVVPEEDVIDATARFR